MAVPSKIDLHSMEEANRQLMARCRLLASNDDIFDGVIKAMYEDMIAEIIMDSKSAAPHLTGSLRFAHDGEAKKMKSGRWSARVFIAPWYRKTVKSKARASYWFDAVGRRTFTENTKEINRAYKKLNYSSLVKSYVKKGGDMQDAAGMQKKVFSKLTNKRVIKPSKYAHLVEFGTRFMAARPFMIPAVNASMRKRAPEFQRLMMRSIERQCEEKGA